MDELSFDVTVGTSIAVTVIMWIVRLHTTLRGNAQNVGARQFSGMAKLKPIINMELLNILIARTVEALGLVEKYGYAPKAIVFVETVETIQVA